MSPDDIYLDKYSGWYSVRDEAYFDESELAGGEGGQKLAPSGAPVEWVEEESYFFRLSAYQDRLLKLYEENPDFIQPDSRRNEIVSFVKSGLRDLSISRTTFSWGVPVPDAPKHVMYVWVDALSNYITALGYPDSQGEMTRWPADIHIIGKDITRFHAIYWPAFLMSAKLALPKRIFGHGFIYSRGEKMSKSVGNVIAPKDLIATYGLDPIRYFLLREAAFGHDANISHEAVVQRMNSDLANGLGNLAQRVLSFINKNAGAAVPTPGALVAADEALLNGRTGSAADAAQGICRASLPSRARGDLAGDRGERSLCRRIRALDLAQDRSGADGYRALRADPGDPASRDAGPAGDADRGRQAARSARRAQGQARLRQPRDTDRIRHGATEAGGRVPEIRGADEHMKTQKQNVLVGSTKAGTQGNTPFASLDSRLRGNDVVR